MEPMSSELAIWEASQPPEPIESPEAAQDSAYEQDDNSTLYSIASIGSTLAIGSIGSIASAFNIGSIASAFSVGSIGSVMSVGSILSIKSTFSILSINSQFSILSKDKKFAYRNQEYDPKEVVGNVKNFGERLGKNLLARLPSNSA